MPTKSFEYLNKRLEMAVLQILIESQNTAFDYSIILTLLLTVSLSEMHRTLIGSFLSYMQLNKSELHKNCLILFGLCSHKLERFLLFL